VPRQSWRPGVVHLDSTSSPRIFPRRPNDLVALASASTKGEPKARCAPLRGCLWLVHGGPIRKNSGQIRVGDGRDSGSIRGRGCREDQTLVGCRRSRDPAARSHGCRPPRPGEGAGHLGEDGNRQREHGVAARTPSRRCGDRVRQRLPASGARAGESGERTLGSPAASRTPHPTGEPSLRATLASAPVAQGIEQGTSNPQVAGSNPARRAGCCSLAVDAIRPTSHHPSPFDIDPLPGRRRACDDLCAGGVGRSRDRCGG
jgi:hypothetical protein